MTHAFHRPFGEKKPGKVIHERQTVCLQKIHPTPQNMDFCKQENWFWRMAGGDFAGSCMDLWIRKINKLLNLSLVRKVDGWLRNLHHPCLEHP